jgi:hypothetical protein
LQGSKGLLNIAVNKTHTMTQTTITMRVALNGTVKGNIAGFDFGAMVEPEPSIDGINEGRVCRLTLNNGSDDLLMYDRGWYLPVPDSCRTLYEQVMRALEELPA